MFHRQILKAIIIGYLFFLSFPVSLASEPKVYYPFPSKTQSLRFEHLITEFRCVVCQNENLADSNAGIAGDLRQQIYQQVLEDRSDVTIKQYLISRYGEFILFKPAFNTKTYLLWLFPWILLLIGGLIWWRNFHRQSESLG